MKHKREHKLIKNNDRNYYRRGKKVDGDSVLKKSLVNKEKAEKRSRLLAFIHRLGL